MGEFIPMTYAELKNAIKRRRRIRIPINEWDVSNITDMTELFKNDKTFNEDISDWDVSNVTSMRGMFSGAINFNQPLNWDVSNVIDMSEMFNGAENFNQDIGHWDVSNVEEMSYMFCGAENFNQDISGWDVSDVINMDGMFLSATSFNQPLNGWNVSNVIDMSEMFYGASEFNQPLNDWDVSNVTNMREMFSDAINFNQPLNNWDVRNVVDMSEMFFEASEFNQPLNNWVLNEHVNMENMFAGQNMLMTPENYPGQHRHLAQAPQIVQRNLNINIQVHEYSGKIKMKELKELLAKDIQISITTLNASDLKPWLSNLIDIAIDDQNDAQDLKHKLELMTNKLLSISQLPEYFMNIIKNIVNYVNAQSKQFKRNYVNDLIEQSVSAYYGENNVPNQNTLSCVQGIAERFIFALKAGCVETMDTDDNCFQIVRAIDGLDSDTYTLTSTVPNNDLQNIAPKCAMSALLKFPTLEERKSHVEQCIMNKLVDMRVLLDISGVNIQDGKRLVTNQVKEYVDLLNNILKKETTEGGNKRKTRKSRKTTGVSKRNRNLHNKRYTKRNIKNRRKQRNTRK